MHHGINNWLVVIPLCIRVLLLLHACNVKIGIAHGCLLGSRGPTPTKIVYEIPNPMIILARFQIPDQDSSPKISVQAGARWLRNQVRAKR